jgi:hypothetical protein
MAYFYFDFRNAGKQGLQDLLRSFLIQLSAHPALRCDILSNLCSSHDEGENEPGDRDLLRSLLSRLSAHPASFCDILSNLYSSHDDGKNEPGDRDLLRSLLSQPPARPASRCDILSNLYSPHGEVKIQPGDRDLAECLKRMLKLPDERPTYLIIDALDESPNSPGIPSPREKVLQLVEELVELCLPNLRICVTSRPEIDIRNVLEPLTSLRVSLHDQSGQKEDIADYVRSVVYSKSEQIMRRWRTEDKELVIESLSERADGM